LTEKSNNIVWHNATVTRQRREELNRHRGIVLWFTGLSGSGKSTLAHTVEDELHKMGCRTFVFDGDNVRHGLCSDLGFNENDRSENIRRIGEMVKLFMEAGVISLTAFISPMRKDRHRVRDLLDKDEFIEIYCKCPLEICEDRDVKGLYKKAREGKIENFTGISAPYEEPEQPDITIDTSVMPLNEAAQSVVEYLVRKSVINRKV
jgi:adenylylsulfate kinase